MSDVFAIESHEGYEIQWKRERDGYRAELFTPEGENYGAVWATDFERAQRGAIESIDFHIGAGPDLAAQLAAANERIAELEAENAKLRGYWLSESRAHGKCYRIAVHWRSVARGEV